MKTCPDCNGDGVVDKGTRYETTATAPDDDDGQEEVIKTRHVTL